MSRIIGTIRKNVQEDIAVSLRTDEGYRFADLRVIARRPDGEPVLTGAAEPMNLAFNDPVVARTYG